MEKKGEKEWNYRHFQKKKKEKKVIDKILRTLIVTLLVIIIIMLVDGTGTLAQIYEREYGEWPDSWVIKPIGEWYEEKQKEEEGIRQHS